MAGLGGGVSRRQGAEDDGVLNGRVNLVGHVGCSVAAREHGETRRNCQPYRNRLPPCARIFATRPSGTTMRLWRCRCISARASAITVSS